MRRAGLTARRVRVPDCQSPVRPMLKPCSGSCSRTFWKRWHWVSVIGPEWPSPRECARSVSPRGRRAARQVAVETDLARGGLPIRANRAQIKQVILNLLLNVARRIPVRDHGSGLASRSVRRRNHRLRRDRIQRRAGRPGPAAAITEEGRTPSGPRRRPCRPAGARAPARGGRASLRYIQAASRPVLRTPPAGAHSPSAFVERSGLRGSGVR
jgi:hypothetical protein